MDVRTVEYLDRHRPELTLVDRSCDVRAVAEHLGLEPGEYGCCFVRVEDGDYAEVWGCESAVPYLHCIAVRLK